jgi:hypothetical protein
MKNRAVLTIVISIITGFILGFIVSSQITRLRLRDVKSISSSKSFKTRTYEIINPEEEQIEDLDPVIERYSEKFDSMRKTTHEGYRNLIESYHQELRPHLSEEQYQELQNFARQIRKKKHHHKKEKEE